MKKIKIGIFDSGVGGLTVAKAIYKRIPNCQLIYFGDSSRVPYGNKSKENIISYSMESVSFLIAKGAEIVVVACNTSSAIALDTLKKNFKIPILGVIEPGVDAAIKLVKTLSSLAPQAPQVPLAKHSVKPFIKTSSITIAATFRTVDTHIYKKKINEYNPLIKVYEIACPLLVPVIEGNFKNLEIIEAIIKEYLNKSVSKSNILVLGCTHYPLIKKFIKKIFPQLKIIDSAESISLALEKILLEKFFLNSKKTKKKIELQPATIVIYTNDKNEVFNHISKRIFPQEKVHRV